MRLGAADWSVYDSHHWMARKSDLSFQVLFYSRRLAWAHLHGDLRVPKSRKIGQAEMNKYF